MRVEFSKHWCLGQEWRRLSETAEKMVSRSFLCLGFVASQPVIASRTVCLLCGAECVEESIMFHVNYMSSTVRKNTLPTLIARLAHVSII